MRYLPLIALFALLLVSCQKEASPFRGDYLGVCDMQWQCGWPYMTFIEHYGEPQGEKRFKIQMEQREVSVIWCNWACYDISEEGRIPVMWMFAEFQDGRLKSWVITEERANLW